MLLHSCCFFEVQEHISEQDYPSVEDPDSIFLSVRICHAEEPFSEELRAEGCCSPHDWSTYKTEAVTNMSFIHREAVSPEHLTIRSLQMFTHFYDYCVI